MPRYAALLGASERDPVGVAGDADRRALRRETLLVLGVSLGAAAIRAVLQIVDRLTRPVPLAGQTAAMNTAVTPDRPWLDLAYQLANIALALVPVLLALHLLGRLASPGGSRSPARFLGLDWRKPAADLGWGLALAALVGIPGLGLYLAARALGFNTTVSAANLTDVWWAVPVLVLAAVQNAVLEEVIMVGYLFTRWRQIGWSWPVVLGVSAVIRGTYHLYQGFGGFVGNIAMGLILGLAFLRLRRVVPLVVCHAALDVVAFVGYTVLRARGVSF